MKYKERKILILGAFRGRATSIFFAFLLQNPSKGDVGYHTIHFPSLITTHLSSMQLCCNTGRLRKIPVVATVRALTLGSQADVPTLPLTRCVIPGKFTFLSLSFLVCKWPIPRGYNEVNQVKLSLASAQPRRNARKMVITIIIKMEEEFSQKFNALEDSLPTYTAGSK